MIESVGELLADLNFDFVKRLIAPSHPKPVSGTPAVYPRPEHTITHARVSRNALKVLSRLKQAGFRAYLVGGCVRDLLLGREPKDFDVVTDAHPEQIRRIFRNCRLIGRRFRLAHVHFGREVIEVATFRGAVNGDAKGRQVVEGGRLLQDNVYGTIEEDAWRRDFSVNALYYDFANLAVLDYVGGIEDHKSGTLRLIGDPESRYREDPVRMLRAIRFATKLGFTLHPSCEEPLARLSHLLKDIPPARLYEETLKLFLSGFAVQTFEQLCHYGLFEALFPETAKCLTLEHEGFPITLVAKALENTDVRLAEGKPVVPYFLFAALLWEPVRLLSRQLRAAGRSDSASVQEAALDVIAKQVKHIALPRKVTVPMCEVWSLQTRFETRNGQRVLKLAAHPRFRAAYDFLLLRGQTGEADPALCDWWTRFQGAGDTERKAMLKALERRTTKRRRPKSALLKPSAT